MRSNASTGKKARILFLPVLLIVALLASACGSSSDEGSKSSSDGGSSTAPGLAEAKATVAKYVDRPTENVVKTPVGKEIPSDVTAYWVSCGVPACEQEGKIVGDAAKTLGWDYTLLSTDGTPQSIGNAWAQIIREKPDVAFYLGTPYSQVSQYLKDAKANGTEIFACCVEDPTPTPEVTYKVNTGKDLGGFGPIMAAWVVDDAAKQKDDEPGVVYVNLPDYPVLSALGKEFKSSFSKLCPDCKQHTLDVALADIPKAPEQIVSYLRANPDTKYVVMSTDTAFQGLPAALNAAGLDDIRTIGEGGTTLVRTGGQTVTMGFPNYEVLYALVDSAARTMAGVEIDDSFANAPLPTWFLSQDNLPSQEDMFPLIEDVQDHYKELWGK